jgi:hypothetical protein
MYVRGAAGEMPQIQLVYRDSQSLEVITSETLRPPSKVTEVAKAKHTRYPQDECLVLVMIKTEYKTWTTWTTWTEQSKANLETAPFCLAV